MVSFTGTILCGEFYFIPSDPSIQFHTAGMVYHSDVLNVF